MERLKGKNEGGGEVGRKWMFWIKDEEYGLGDLEETSFNLEHSS